ncbi:MAG: FmdB family zinc ribbon protein [Phycisphaerae bacterium]
MPTYEYECCECGAIVEVFQSITEPARRKLRPTDPKACNCNTAVRRRIGTGAGIIFRGSGFYETDYRSEDYKKAAKADAEAKKGTNGKADQSKTKKKDAGKDSPSPSGGAAKMSTGKAAGKKPSGK